MLADSKVPKLIQLPDKTALPPAFRSPTSAASRVKPKTATPHSPPQSASGFIYLKARQPQQASFSAYRRKRPQTVKEDCSAVASRTRSKRKLEDFNMGRILQT